MPKQTDFLRTLTVDPALVQNARYRFNDDDRQYIDNQIRDLQQFSLGMYRTINGLPKVVTVDATPVAITVATLALGESKQVDVLVRIASVDGTVRKVYKLSALYYNTAGSAARDGALTSTPSGSGLASATLVTSGADVRLQITGIAGTALVSTYDASLI